VCVFQRKLAVFHIFICKVSSKFNLLVLCSLWLYASRVRIVFNPLSTSNRLQSTAPDSRVYLWYPVYTRNHTWSTWWSILKANLEHTSCTFRPGLITVHIEYVCFLCACFMYASSCKRGIRVSIHYTNYWPSARSRPPNRYQVPGFGGRQSRKPGSEKYTAGLHSLLTWHVSCTI